MLCEDRLDEFSRDGLAVRHLDHRHGSRVWIERVGFKLGGRRGADADRQRVDAGEGPVGEGHDPVARLDRGEHHVERGPAGAGNAEGVGVLGAPDLAQHVLAFDHAAQDVGLHVIGGPGGGEAREDAGIGIAGAGARSQSLWNVQLLENTHRRRLPLPGAAIAGGPVSGTCCTGSPGAANLCIAP